MASIPAGSEHIQVRNSRASAGCCEFDRIAAEEPPCAPEATPPSGQVGIGATAHLPSPPGTDWIRASDQEPEIVASTFPSPAAAIHGVEKEP